MGKHATGALVGEEPLSAEARENLGRLVHDENMRILRESVGELKFVAEGWRWKPWEELSDAHREARRCVGERLFRVGWRAANNRYAMGFIDDEVFFSALLNRLGFVDDGGVDATIGTHNDRVTDRARALLRLIETLREEMP
jgi:hypothetical protein